MIRLLSKPDDYYLIPLVDAKRHIRVDADFDDGKIYDLILQAQEYVELYTGVAVFLGNYQYTPTGEQDYDGRYNPTIIDSVYSVYDRVTIRKGTITEIVSIKSFDTAGTETAETLTDYTFINYNQYSEIIRKDGSSFPLGARTYNPLEVEFKAGFTQATLPLNIKLAMLELIGLWYEVRDSILTGTETPFGVRNKLMKYRLVSV